MNFMVLLRKYLIASPVAAAIVYAGLLLVLLATIVSSFVDTLSQRATVAASGAMLAQLEGRKPTKARSGEPGVPSGSPFLEGVSVTVARAALLQPAPGAVTKFSG